MRVLLSCLQSPKRHPVAAYEYWRLYFTKGCEEAGIEFVEVPDVDWVEGIVHLQGEELNRWRASTWERVLSFVRREHARKPLDFFLGYLYPQQIEVAAINELQRLEIPCVNFFCDNIREFHRVPDEYHPFALHWVPEFEALPMYRKAGLPHIHAPMPCWIPSELRTVPVAESEPPTFIGSADVLRRNLFGEALKVGADFIVRGPGWQPDQTNSIEPLRPNGLGQTLKNQLAMMRQHGFLSLSHKLENRFFPPRTFPIPASKIRPAVFGAEYFRVTREAEVTIGVNRVPTARRSNRNPLAYSRLRDLEAPMLGACYLTEWTEGLGQLYELGTEIETYRTAEELCVKLKELQNDPQRRQIMRRKAQQRALAKYSVSETLKRICGLIVSKI